LSTVPGKASAAKAGARRQKRLAAIGGSSAHARDHLTRATIESLNGLGLPALTVDLGGVVRACNEAAGELYRCGPDALLGRPIVGGVVSGHHALGTVMIRETIATGSWRGAMLRAIGDGRHVEVNVRATLLGSHDRPAGVLVVFPDGLDGLSADRGPRNRHRTIVEEGSWQWDPQDDRIVGTRNLAADGELVRDAQATWRAALDSISDSVAVLDEFAHIIEVNRAWREFASTNGDGGDYIGVNYLDVCKAASDPIAERAAVGLRELLAGVGDHFELIYPCHSPTAERWFSMRATRHTNGDRLRVVVAHQDVTDRRLERSEARLRAALLDEVDVAVHATDLKRNVLSWNAGAERLFGWTAAEAIGRNCDEIVVSSQTHVDPVVRRRIDEGKWEGDTILARKDGSSFPAYVRTRLTEVDERGERAIVVVTLDMTAQLQGERELKLAQDHLRAVTDSVGEGMVTLDAGGAVTYMNPMAEERLGWSLEELRGRLMHDIIHFRHTDGSPFPIEDCPIIQAQRSGAVARVDEDVFVRSDGSDLPVAYTAAPFSSQNGREGCVIVFQDVTERKAEAHRVGLELEKLGWLKRVREALDDDRFVLFAQPIVELADQTVVQHELLIRMQDPKQPGAVITPGAFLPVAEEYGFIADIDRWVIDRSAELAARGLAVELNVSAASISDSALIPHIAAAFDRTGADPTKIVFEITETALLNNHAAGRGFVEWLHEIGCAVALDDFGTGYGGFTYLKQLPIDYVKIDVEFVHDMVLNPASRNVVEAIVDLAQRFDLRTVAEGVEDAATLTLLGDVGVDYAQGYHIGRPAPLEFECTPSIIGGSR
jgi:PAS domain S-box-containing protein